MPRKSHLKIVVSYGTIKVIFLEKKKKSFSVPLRTFNFFSVQKSFIGHLLCTRDCSEHCGFSEEWDLVPLLGSLLYLFSLGFLSQFINE